MNYFDQYVSNYDMNDPDINYKYYHSYRVMDAAELIATKLNLSESDIHLAKVIGLLHDIGRFEQDKLYNSFKDGKMDHGNYGVEVLKENNVLDYFDINKEDYEVVYKAVKNHNKFKIEDNLTERELLFSKIAKDADKLDILYVLGEEKYKHILRQDEQDISQKLKEAFYNHQLGNVKDVINENDGLFTIFCYIYDIHFDATFEKIYKEKYYDKIYERIIKKTIFKPYLDYVNKFIKERID